MKPMIIIPPDVMNEADIKELRDNGICVVVATDPSKVKFVDPIPTQSSRTEIEAAAIKLSRKMLAGQTGFTSIDSNRWTVASAFAQILVEGSPLDADGTFEEQKAKVEKNVYDSARHEELRKMAREDARAEREKKKQASK